MEDKIKCKRESKDRDTTGRDTNKSKGMVVPYFQGITITKGAHKHNITHGDEANTLKNLLVLPIEKRNDVSNDLFNQKRRGFEIPCNSCNKVGKQKGSLARD